MPTLVIPDIDQAITMVTGCGMRNGAYVGFGGVGGGGGGSGSGRGIGVKGGTIITDWDLLNTASTTPLPPSGTVITPERISGVGIIGCGEGEGCEVDADCFVGLHCTNGDRYAMVNRAKDNGGGGVGKMKREGGGESNDDDKKYCTRLIKTSPPFVIIETTQRGVGNGAAFIQRYYNGVGIGGGRGGNAIMIVVIAVIIGVCCCGCW